MTLLPDIQRLHIVVHDVTSDNTGSIVIHADKLRAIWRNFSARSPWRQWSHLGE